MSDGLTGSEIAHLLQQARIPEIAPGATLKFLTNG
jgi:hypothetical protein